MSAPTARPPGANPAPGPSRPRNVTDANGAATPLPPLQSSHVGHPLVPAGFCTSGCSSAPEGVVSSSEAPHSACRHRTCFRWWHLPGLPAPGCCPPGPRWGARGAAPSPGVTNGQDTSCTGTRNEPRCAALPSPAPLPCKSSAGLVHRTIPAAHCPGTASTEAQALHQAAPGPQEKFKATSA